MDISREISSGLRARRHSQRMRGIRIAMLAANPHCWYCGFPLSIQFSTLDHVEPVSRGGSNFRSNLVLACRRCNARKGPLPIEMVVVQRFRGCGLLSPNHILRLFNQVNSVTDGAIGDFCK